MSDPVRHECGIALIRLLKPLEYYLGKYGTSFYGLNKLHLLMEKQHNRGQDGAGIACLKFDLKPGHRYINRIRSKADAPINDIFSTVYSSVGKIREKNSRLLNDVQWLKENSEFTGELFLGHLRYGTFGSHSIDFLHPTMRENNWKTRNLVLAGNFNLTNVDELFNKLVSYGQSPVATSDTVTILEKIGHYLDEENERLYQHYRGQGFEKEEISIKIAESIDILSVLQNASKYWDGGYVIAGMFGHGDAFVIRDPSGIRPAYFYQDDEVVVAASERPVIQTAFNITADEVRELSPGHALIIRKNGEVIHDICTAPLERRSCSFERIYFSRGTDKDIYLERKKLGKALMPSILEAINHDLDNTVFSYIPNTAVDAYYGLVSALHDFCNVIKKDKILEARDNLSPEVLADILKLEPRIEKIAVKDVKMRTFIAQDVRREDLVAHVYDVTYGVVRPGKDNLVVLDDSIVRGTTLRTSIIRILDRLSPRRIIIASSAPQIRYPDCYGIDMAKLSDFVVFNAAIALLRETGQEHVISEVYRKCKAQEHLPKEEMVNHVKAIYAPFTVRQLSEKVAALVSPPQLRAGLQIIYQSIEDLHEACPGHTGDWYFTGNYPTPGGNKVVNRSFINYIEGRNERAY